MKTVIESTVGCCRFDSTIHDCSEHRCGLLHNVHSEVVSIRNKQQKINLGAWKRKFRLDLLTYLERQLNKFANALHT